MSILRISPQKSTFIDCQWKGSEIAQSCSTLCDPMDRSLLGSSISGIFWSKVLEWVAVSFYRGSSWPRDWTQVYLHWRQTLYPLSHQGSALDYQVRLKSVSTGILYSCICSPLSNGHRHFQHWSNGNQCQWIHKQKECCSLRKANCGDA